MKILEEEGKIVLYPTGHINTDNVAVFEKEATARFLKWSVLIPCLL